MFLWREIYGGYLEGAGSITIADTEIWKAKEEMEFRGDQGEHEVLSGKHSKTTHIIKGYFRAKPVRFASSVAY